VIAVAVGDQNPFYIEPVLPGDGRESFGSETGIDGSRRTSLRIADQLAEIPVAAQV
jgi:hypothetical protein